MRSVRRRIRDYAIAVSSVALGKVIPARRCTVLPGDIFLCSYPRSGNTWTRFLLGNLIYADEPVTFANVERKMPSIYTYPDRILRTLPRYLKSHEVFDPRYPKVLYIVRDPRDVGISCYHYYIKRNVIPETCTMDEFIPRFVAPEFDVNWGSWADNVMSWLLTRGESKKFLLVRYEDLQQIPQPVLKRVAEFFQISSDTERIERAITLSSAQRMRELERTQGKDWVLTKKTRDDKPFVGKAKSGGWKEVLSPKAIAVIEAAWGPVMQHLGYELMFTKDELEKLVGAEAAHRERPWHLPARDPSPQYANLQG